MRKGAPAGSLQKRNAKNCPVGQREILREMNDS